jgi:hypothetical protein
MAHAVETVLWVAIARALDGDGQIWGQGHRVAGEIKGKHNEAPTYISAWSLRALNPSSDDCNHDGDARDLVAEDSWRPVRL